MPPRATVMSGPGLLLGPMSGFMTLMHPCSVLMFMALDTIEDQEDRAVQSWPHPLTDCTLRENWPCPLPAKALRKQGPCLGSTIELTLLTGEQMNPSQNVSVWLVHSSQR